MDAIDPNSVYADAYRQYLQNNQALHQVDGVVNQALQNTLWEDPKTDRDYRNAAVVALVIAESSEDAQRSLYLNGALEALQSTRDPICAAHRCLLAVLLGEPKTVQQALSTLLSLAAADLSETLPLGLVYVPPTRPPALRSDLLLTLWQARNPQHQALLLTVEALRRSPLVFYNAQGLRFLQLAVAHYPQVAVLQLQLGVAMLFSGRVEGMVNLHEAQTLASQGACSASAAMYQALHLAYRPLSEPQANRWHRQAIAAAQGGAAWRWTRLPPDSPITYIPFDGLTLAVEANLRSIVTSVLLTEGTWFEAELALWQQHIQPGMVVIDVGANVGVYTFSAAVRVGRSGRVFAVEPFAGCVQCLEETCRVNALDWVTVCAAAASDRPGSAQLSLNASSELNELVTGPTDPAGPAVDKSTTVSCITLDSLVDEHGLERVDWIKIDAEGHELSVLQGATSLLQRFRPRVLYENVAAAQGANLEVSRWLQQAGYRLHRYRPYAKELEPVENLTGTQGVLNLVAIPAPHRS